MYLYTEKGERKRITPIDKLGSGIQGTVYKLPNDTCLKLFKGNKNDIKIPTIIKKLNLESINKIYDFYYDKNGIFKGYTKEYQEEEKIDILTMPTSYTLENLHALYDSISQLSDLNILASDLHTNNIIMNKNKITVIDVDNFRKSLCYGYERVYQKNLDAVIYLFKELYRETIESNYTEEEFFNYYTVASSIFNQFKDNPIEEATRKLIKYKYPIDYLKKGR